jgi:hypothetical protein
MSALSIIREAARKLRAIAVRLTRRERKPSAFAREIAKARKHEARLERRLIKRKADLARLNLALRLDRRRYATACRKADALDRETRELSSGALAQDVGESAAGEVGRLR